jgi:hypothetical protein
MEAPPLVELEPFMLSDLAPSGVEAAVPASCADSAESAAVLVFVEAPQEGLAAALEAERLLDPSGWLARWLEGARALTRAAHRDPDRITLVDAREAREHPAALTALCGQRFGGIVPFGHPLAEPGPSSRALAQLAVAADAAVEAALQGLLSCCVPLSDDFVIAAAPGPAALRASAAAVVTAWSEERRLAEQSCSGLAERAAAAESRCADLASQLTAKGADALRVEAELRARVGTLEDRLVRAEREGERLTEGAQALEIQLRQAREELEQLLARQRAETSMAEAARQRDASEAAVAEARQALAAASARSLSAADEEELLLAQLHQAQEELEQQYFERRRLEGDMAGLQAHAQQLSEARAASEALLVELHQVQEDYEKQFLVARHLQRELTQARDAVGGLERRLDAMSALSARRLEVIEQAKEARRVELQEQRRLQNARIAEGCLVVGSIALGPEQDAPPHRHLALELHGVQLGDRSSSVSAVRLVEHLGRPGLVLFSSAGNRHWLGAWLETGREGEQTYMALLPTDAPCRDILQCMPSRDWRALLSLVELVEQRLGAADARAVVSWRDVARRLLAQLHEFPARFRYDGLRLVEPPADAPGQRCLSFDHVVYGARRFERVALALCTDPGARGLHLLADVGGRLPLLQLPYGAEAGHSGRFALPHGPGVPASEQQQRWHAVAPEDRAFLLALLEAAHGAVQAGALGDVLTADDRALIEATMRDAQRAESGVLAPRTVLRRLASRMEPAASGPRAAT